MIGWWTTLALICLDLILWGLLQSGRPSAEDTRLWVHASPRSIRLAQMASPVARITRPLIRGVTVPLGRMIPAGQRRRESDRLLQAGLDWDPALFDAVKIAGGLAGIVSALLARILAPLPGGLWRWMALAGGFGFLTPAIWIRQRAVARVREFRATLPDALDVLVICLRAGLGFHASVAEYAQYASGVTGEAFRGYLGDLALGQTPEAGLAKMAERFPDKDLAVVSAGFVQQIRLGTPLADVLEEQAAHFRVVALRRAEERARTLTTRLILPLVLFIFPLVFIVGLGPIVLRLLGPGGLLR
jgi:tight adherence protein C